MKKLLLLTGIVATFSSCTIYRDYQLTGEPIGTKTGISKSKVLGNSDYSINKAAENGDITTIGAVEITSKIFFLFPVTTTKVYGN